MGFDIKKITTHYMVLADRLVKDEISIEDLQFDIKRDVGFFKELYETKKMNLLEYESILITIGEFEDTFEHIINMKQHKIEN